MARQNSRSHHTAGKRKDRFTKRSRGGAGEQRPLRTGGHNATPSARINQRKKLSQNFLTDPRIAAAVVRQAEVGGSRLVLEIGPGQGILTKALARKCRRVTAYELDPKYARRLDAAYRDEPGVTCHHRDFLTVKAPQEAFSVVANIPYSRTNAIVYWCLEAPTLESATLITQWEYARKRSGDYGRWSRLTVLSWPRYDWRLLGRIDRRKFHPVPRIDSGILRIDRRGRPLLSGEQLRRYEELVMLGFTGVGGDLYGSLRRAVPANRLRKALAGADINPGVPVGYVSPTQWLRLTDAIGS